MCHADQHRVGGFAVVGLAGSSRHIASNLRGWLVGTPFGCVQCGVVTAHGVVAAGVGRCIGAVKKRGQTQFNSLATKLETLCKTQFLKFENYINQWFTGIYLLNEGFCRPSIDLASLTICVPSGC